MSTTHPKSGEETTPKSVQDDVNQSPTIRSRENPPDLLSKMSTSYPKSVQYDVNHLPKIRSRDNPQIYSV
jgi:hypothetical protein